MMRLTFLPALALFPRRLFVALVVAISLLVALGAYAFYNLRQQAEAADWVSHTYRVVSCLQGVFSSVQDAESAQRAFVISGNETYLVPCNNALRALPAELDDLGGLVRDNPHQQRSLSRLRRSIDERLALIRTRIDQRRQLGAGALDLKLLSGSGVHLMEAVRGDIDAMSGEEKALLAARRVTLATARWRAAVIQTAAGVTSLLLLAAVFLGLAKQMGRANRAEDAAEDSNIRLREANDELRAFSYSVAHDLRAPLRAINGFAEILNEDCAGQLDEAGQRALGRITANSTKMATLIDDLLALSAVSMQPVHKGKVEMTTLVRGAYQELLEGQKGRHIECNIAPLPPASGDPSLLRQVWLNLIANALKFTRGCEHTRIEIGGTVAGPDFATYFIRDNGAGFDMQYADKLFGAFERLHRPTDFEGTGIGLALVQRIIQRHGGTIWAEGEENQGARFAFTLPEWNES